MSEKLGHRYLNPNWWVLRLSPILSRYLPAPNIMNLLGYTSLFSSEPEVTRLRGFFEGDGVVIDVGAANGLVELEQGRVVAQGSYQELMTRSQSFQRMAGKI